MVSPINRAYAAVGRVRLRVEPNADGKQKRHRAIKLNANKRMEDLPSTNANPCDSGELKKRLCGGGIGRRFKG